MADEVSQNTMNVTDPFGHVGSLPMDQAREAMDNGYRPATLDEIKSAKNEQQFGGVQGAIFSGTLGAARSATLGLSDLALENLPEGVGFSKEELQGFRETNPKSTLVGELGGILEDPLHLGKMITSAGKATTQGTKAILGAAKAAEDSSTAAKVLEATMQNSVEGALYGGVASTIDDKAFGDPSLNGEKVLANVGLGYFLGGASGGALKLLGLGISPAIKKAINGLSEIKNELIGSGYGEEALVSKVLPKKFADAITDRQLNLDTKGQAENLRKISTNLNSVVGHVEDEIKNFNNDIHAEAVSSLFSGDEKRNAGKLQQVGEFLKGSLQDLKSLIVPYTPSSKEINSVVDEINNTVKSTLMSNGYSQGLFKSLSKLGNQLRMSMAIHDVDPALKQAVEPITQVIDGLVKDPSVFGPIGAATALHNETVSGFRRFISDGKELTPFQETFGKVENGKWQFDITKLHEALSDTDYNRRGANLSELSDFYEALKSMPDNLLNARRTIPNSSWRKKTINQIISNAQKSNEEAYQDYLAGINKRRPLYGWKDYAPVLIAKWHPAIAAAIEAYDWYQDPIHATHGLALVERMLGNSTEAASKAVDAVFDPSNVMRSLIQKEGKAPHFSDQDEERREKIKRFAREPDMVAENLEKSTKDLQEIAPNISQHLHLSAQNAASFLASKLPQGSDHMNPLQAPYEPSANEMAKFERYQTIVENPVHALEQIKNRTITPETVEALTAVYPKFYQQMKESLLEKAFQQKSKGKTIPYQTKQAISLFLGEPIESSMSPQSILANQSIMAVMPKEEQGQLKPRAKGLDQMERSDRLKQNYSGIAANE